MCAQNKIKLWFILWMSWYEKERLGRNLEQSSGKINHLEWKINFRNKTKLKYKNNRCNSCQLHLRNGVLQDICLTSLIFCERCSYTITRLTQ